MSGADTTSESAQRTWAAVDRALEAWLAPEDGVLRETAAAAARAGLPEIAVAPAQGRLLQVLARAVGARRILEVGTLAGASAIWLGRALPAGGRLVTLELDAGRAELARANLARAGLAESVEVVTGPAVDTLDAMVAAGTEPFDLVFIDADKERCPHYLERAVALARPGSLIVVDNVVCRGRLIDPASGDAGVDGVRAMMDLVASHPRLDAAVFQSAGAKGYDGMLLAVVVDRKINGGPAAPRPDGPPSDPLAILLGHDAWATRELLRRCAALDEADWHRRFEIGPGSLHDTLTHVIGAMFRWADRIDGPPAPLRPSIEGDPTPRRTPSQLLALLDEAASDLAASAARARIRGLGTIREVTLGGTSYRFTLGAMLVHVTTHGMHHRAQCLNMLRRIGGDDRPLELDVLEWAWRPMDADRDRH